VKRLQAALVIACSIVSGTAAASPHDNPAEFFDDDCRACHTIGGGPAVGPDLKGVTARQSREWITRFILDPQKVVDSGDPYAKQLVAAADGFVMPPVDDPLTPEFIGRLLDYIEAQGGEGAAAPPAAVVAERPFTDADVALGRAHFTGATPLSAGGPACIACHKIGDLTAFGGGGLGPDLTKVYARLQGRRGLTAWLSSPPTPTMRAVYGARKFTPEEAESLVALFEHENAVTVIPRMTWLPFVASGMAGTALALISMMWLWRGRFRSVRRPLVRTGAAGGTR
jgi:cytochrome c2